MPRKKPVPPPALPEGGGGEIRLPFNPGPLPPLPSALSFAALRSISLGAVCHEPDALPVELEHAATALAASTPPDLQGPERAGIENLVALLQDAAGTLVEGNGGEKLEGALSDVQDLLEGFVAILGDVEAKKLKDAWSAIPRAEELCEAEDEDTLLRLDPTTFGQMVKEALTEEKKAKYKEAILRELDVYLEEKAAAAKDPDLGTAADPGTTEDPGKAEDPVVKSVREFLQRLRGQP